MTYKPPSIHSFPPFFTLQPNTQTKAAQLNQWRDIILEWAQEESIWSLDQRGSPIDGNEELGSIFVNKPINRSVQSDLLDEIFQNLINSSNGIWEKGSSNEIFLLLPKPISTYAQELQDQLNEGGVTNIMLTLYELQDQYTSLPKSHLRLVLDQLQQSGFLKIVYDDDNKEDIMGIKVA